MSVRLSEFKKQLLHEKTMYETDLMAAKDKVHELEMLILRLEKDIEVIASVEHV